VSWFTAAKPNIRLASEGRDDGLARSFVNLTRGGLSASVLRSTSNGSRKERKDR
jgi:hypothetical protein